MHTGAREKMHTDSNGENAHGYISKDLHRKMCKAFSHSHRETHMGSHKKMVLGSHRQVHIAFKAKPPNFPVCRGK